MAMGHVMADPLHVAAVKSKRGIPPRRLALAQDKKNIVMSTLLTYVRLA